MHPASAIRDRPQPARGPRPGRRDLIVDVFLGQDAQLTADALFDLVRQRDPRVGRATVYRTLRWMTEAGVARKIEVGHARVRFEHSFRQPRPFDCQRESTRGAPDASVDLVSERDALRLAIATERSAIAFSAHAAEVTGRARGRVVFLRLAEDERAHLEQLEARYEGLLRRDPLLESRPTVLFLKAVTSGLFTAAAGELTRDVEDRRALMIGIRCERGSYRFFRRGARQLEQAGSRRVFLECASEKRAHLDLLIREYRALLRRGSKPPARRRSSAPRPVRTQRVTA